MITYIVRVYRRDDSDLEKIMGMAEIVETQEKKVFANYTELRNIISSPKEGKGRRKRDGKAAKEKS